MPFQAIDAALQQYRSGRYSSIRQAAINHEVPRTTLQDRNLGRLPWAEAFQYRRTVLPGDEKGLARYIRTQTIAGYPIDKPTLSRLANQSLHRRAEAGERDVPSSVGKN